MAATRPGVATLLALALALAGTARAKSWLKNPGGPFSIAASDAGGVFCLDDSWCYPGVARCYRGYCQFNLWSIQGQDPEIETCDDVGATYGAILRPDVVGNGFCLPALDRCAAIGCNEGGCVWCGAAGDGSSVGCFGQCEDYVQTCSGGVCRDTCDVDPSQCDPGFCQTHPGQRCLIQTGGPKVVGVCDSGNCVVRQINDPEFTGYDGKKFHFDKAGTFVVQEDGEGYKVETTFAAGQSEDIERSFTQSVRVFAPNGEVVSCDLPGIQPNTHKLHVTALGAGASSSSVLTPESSSINLTTLSVTAGVANDGQRSSLKSCTIVAPRFQITVYQVVGSDQAAAFDFEAWTAPFTWLNMNLALRKPLIPPVTGILGNTYPTDLAAEAEALLQAAVEMSNGPEEAATTSRRRLAAGDEWLVGAGLA